MIQTWLMVAGLLSLPEWRLSPARLLDCCRIFEFLLVLLVADNFLECVSAREYCVRFAHRAPQ